MLHIGFNVQDHPQNPMYFPPMYVPRIPAMLIQIITIVFLRQACDLYSSALLVPSVALLMSSSAFPTFFPKDKNNAIVQYFETFSNYTIKKQQVIEWLFAENLPILFITSSWPSINGAISKNIS